MSDSDKLLGGSSTRRRFLTRTMAAGTATLFAPTLLGACDKAADALDDAGIDTSNIDTSGVPDIDIPDLDQLLETLTLDEGYLIADTRSGRFYRIDQEAHTVAQLDSGLNELWSYGGLGEEENQLNYPISVSPHPDGSVSILDAGNQRLVVLDKDGAFMRAVGEHGEGEGQFLSMRGAVVDDDGVAWVTDPLGHSVQRIAADGTITRAFGDQGETTEQLNAPRGISLDGDGNLHIVDAGNARVQVFKRDGTHVRSYGGYGEGDGRHLIPRGIAIAPNGFSYVSDPVAGAVQIYNASGDAIARLDDLSLGGKSAVPLDVSMSANGLVQVRLHTWTAAA